MRSILWFHERNGCCATDAGDHYPSGSDQQPTMWDAHVAAINIALRESTRVFINWSDRNRGRYVTPSYRTHYRRDFGTDAAANDFMLRTRAGNYQEKLK